MVEPPPLTQRVGGTDSPHYPWWNHPHSPRELKEQTANNAPCDTTLTQRVEGTDSPHYPWWNQPQSSRELEEQTAHTTHGGTSHTHPESWRNRQPTLPMVEPATLTQRVGGTDSPHSALCGATLTQRVEGSEDGIAGERDEYVASVVRQVRLQRLRQ